MFRRTRQPHTFPIGLDLGSDAVRLLQLRAAGPAGADGCGALAVAAVARRELPAGCGNSPDARLAAALHVARDLLRGDTGFTGREVVVALPRHLVECRALRLPLPPGNAAALTGHHVPDASLDREAAAAFGLDLSTAYVRYLHAGEVRHNGEPRREVIAVAAGAGRVDHFLEQLNRAGAAAASLEVQPVALYRAAAAAGRIKGPGAITAGEGDVVALVDVGDRATQVVIGRGPGGVCLMRSVGFGGRRFTSAVSRRLGISFDDARQLRRRLEQSAVASETSAGDDAGRGAAAAGRERDPVRQAVHDAIRAAAEELAAEVVLCMRYYSVSFRGRPPARLFVTGGEARFAQVRNTLRSALGFPAEVPPLFAGIDTAAMAAAGLSPADFIGPAAGEWALALGLALRGLPAAAAGAPTGGRLSPLSPGHSQGSPAPPKPDARSADAEAEVTVHA